MVKRRNMPSLPPDPFANNPLRAAAMAAKQLYDEFIAAGFTEDQALYLVPQFARNDGEGRDGPAPPLEGGHD